MSEPAKDEAELIGAIACVFQRPIGCTADHAAKVAIAAIRAAGWAVVPQEPTDEMLWAADRAPVPECETDNPDHLQFVLFAVRRAEWTAMLAAAHRSRVQVGERSSEAVRVLRRTRSSAGEVKP